MLHGFSSLSTDLSLEEDFCCENHGEKIPILIELDTATSS